MGWSHPDISLEDLLQLIKGFVDMLILASGYQSSGLLAHWDSQNIKTAFHWGLFLENVFRRLSCLDGYQDSIKEVDAALSEMISSPNFPQGLKHLSSATLSTAREFILEHLIHTLPLRDTHLRSFLTATTEMDLDELRAKGSDCLHVYLEKLMLQNTSSNLVSDRRYFMEEDSTTSSPGIIPNRNSENCVEGDFTTFTIQELTKRTLAVSCISSAETGLDILFKTTRESNLTEPANRLFREGLEHATAQMSEEQSVEFVTWNHWRATALSYLLDKRTIRLVSGASMIFSAPKAHWLQVFERLDISAEASEDDFYETLELLLLGCIASKWSSLIQHFMSVSYDFFNISKQYHELHNLIIGGYQNLHLKEEMTNSKVTVVQTVSK